MKVKSDTLHVKGFEVGIYTEDYRNEYISLTDIARFRNSDDPRYAIQNWMRNRNTIEFLGVWECLHNPNFNRVQFDAFRNESGLNYRVHTDAIKQNILPPELTREQQSYVYADEADVLNVALFGITAAQWRSQNVGKKGNIRDYATIQQLLVLANMESYNALLIDQKQPQSVRLQALREMGIRQLQTLSALDVTGLPQLGA